eukprot:COSAG05_NODE_1208_length_5523_cov_14.095686_2_plen_360_part_00
MPAACAAAAPMGQPRDSATAGGVSIDETAMIPALRRVRQLTLALGATGTVALAVSRALDPTQRSRAKSYFTQPHRTAAMTSGLEALTGLHRKERGAPSDALTDPGFPDVWPYTEADLARHDETDDGQFYSQPRLVTHIDDDAIKSLVAFYTTQPAFADPTSASLLDVASSWISHYPNTFTGASSGGRVAGLGMNDYELAQNKQLTEHVVRDLNSDPVSLPYDDASFDAVTIAVSVDYLCKPREVFAEIVRVLRPGGTAYMSFSNRCFPSKVVGMWHQTNDAGHIWLVGSYFHFTPGFAPPVVSPCRARSPFHATPLLALNCTRSSAAPVTVDLPRSCTMLIRRFMISPRGRGMWIPCTS